MTDTDSLVGTVGGLLGIAILAGVANRMINNGRERHHKSSSLFGSDNHKTKGGRSEWW